MFEPLPFDDDRRADALAAFDGLARALRGLKEQSGIAEDQGLPDYQLDEARFRLVDLVTAALDEAGVDDGLARLEALNLMSETLATHLADVMTEELGETDADDEEDSDAILALVFGDPGVLGERARPLSLPRLAVRAPESEDSRN